MKNKLITSLRLAANSLSQGTFEYNWGSAKSCNCGILACALMGKSQKEMEILTIGFNSWERAVREHCPITGIPSHEVMKNLLAAGMTARDIIELENCSNQKVIDRIPHDLKPRGIFKWFWFAKAKYVADYMTAWADLLQEEGAMDSAPQETAKSISELVE